MSIDAEPYILVLGTIEPRKNLADVLSLLSANRQLARSHRFVFGGRTGWGDAFEKQVEEQGLSDLLAERRIYQTGFISEAAKYLFFKNASAVIYPSVYEGFGLPVAEAISLGVPVVTTPTSSLPEVGRTLAQYFLPGDVAMLGSALKAALGQPRRDDADADVVQWRRDFSWSRCFQTIYDALFSSIAEEGDRNVRY